MPQLAISVLDHDQLLDFTKSNQLHVACSTKIQLPAQLKIVISGCEPNQSVECNKLVLGGLLLSNSILNQVCQFTADSDCKTPTVTTRYYSDGIISIDFFAADWIQYHLLYGNKII